MNFFLLFHLSQRTSSRSVRCGTKPGAKVEIFLNSATDCPKNIIGSFSVRPRPSVLVLRFRPYLIL